MLLIGQKADWKKKEQKITEKKAREREKSKEKIKKQLRE